jgi:hypothetical protein
LLGDKQAGLAIQHEVLLSHRLFRTPCAAKQPRGGGGAHPPPPPPSVFPAPDASARW